MSAQEFADETLEDINQRVIAGIIRGVKARGIRGSLLLAGKVLTQTMGGGSCLTMEAADTNLYDIGQVLDVANWLHSFPRLPPGAVAFCRGVITYPPGVTACDEDVMRDTYFYQMAVVAALRYFNNEGGIQDDE